MTKSLVRIYDEFADTYEENRGLFDMSEVFDAFYQRFHISGVGQVLELGCGAGEPFAANFVSKGWSVKGVDFSRRMLELAAKYVPAMETLHSDMREVEFPTEQFDAVTIIYALFHLPRDEHAALFKKVFDWLRPGGKLLFTYATRNYTGKEEFDGYIDFMGQQLYYSHKRPELMRADLERQGFIIEGWDYRDIGGEVFLWVTAGKPDT